MGDTRGKQREQFVNGAAFWNGKRVLLTGHTGFKGGWLSLWLGAMGARVTGYALAPPTDPHFFGITRVGKSVRSMIGDILDRQSLAQAFAESQPEIVFHLAAQPIVRLSYQDPVSTYMTNVMGTVGVLEGVRAAPGVRAVVVVTSDKCYENPEWHWGCREVDPMGGHDPYSSSKGCTELVVSAYRRSFFTAARPGSTQVALASARAGNVIGGGDWARDRLIPDVVRAVLAGQSTVIRNPSAIRPWQHVLESLSGYLELAERLHAGDARFQSGWNFGPQGRRRRARQPGVGYLLRLPSARARGGMSSRTHRRCTRQSSCTSTSPRPEPSLDGSHAGRCGRESRRPRIGIPAI